MVLMLVPLQLYAAQQEYIFDHVSLMPLTIVIYRLLLTLYFQMASLKHVSCTIRDCS